MKKECRAERACMKRKGGGEWVWQWECGRWHNNYVDVSWQPFQPLRRHFVTFIITIITRSSSSSIALSQRLLKLRFTCHPQSRLLCFSPLSLCFPCSVCYSHLSRAETEIALIKCTRQPWLLQLKSAARSLPVSLSLALSISISLQLHLVLSSSRVVS